MSQDSTLMDLPPCWRDYRLAIESGIDRIILFGPPGTGKTFGAMNLGLTPGASSERLIVNEDITDLEIRGGYLPNSRGGVEYVEGAGLRAWRKGARLVVDEGDRASGDSLAVLLAILDSPKSASFTRPDTGEVITPAPGFSAVITSNIEDPDDLPPALRDRFPVAININEAHPEALAMLPEGIRGIASSMVKAEPGRRASLRAFLAYATMSGKIPEEDAIRLAFGPRAEIVREALALADLTGAK